MKCILLKELSPRWTIPPKDAATIFVTPPVNPCVDMAARVVDSLFALKQVTPRVLNTRGTHSAFRRLAVGERVVVPRQTQEHPRRS